MFPTRPISRVLLYAIIYLWPEVTLRLKPSPKTRGPRLSSTTLLRVGFTRPVCLHTAGELLPRLFILTCKQAVFFSVALSLKSPSPGVTRHPCPLKPGLSSRTSFRIRCPRLHRPVGKQGYCITKVCFSHTPRHNRKPHREIFRKEHP